MCPYGAAGWLFEISTTFSKIPVVQVEHHLSLPTFCRYWRRSGLTEALVPWFLCKFQHHLRLTSREPAQEITDRICRSLYWPTSCNLLFMMTSLSGLILGSHIVMGHGTLFRGFVARSHSAIFSKKKILSPTHIGDRTGLH